MAGDYKRIGDLSKARILVTNDDGIHAPGLKVLEEIARSLSSDVWVVAPEVEQSATGHSLSVNTPLRYHRLADRRFSVRGTPTDSVLMAVRALIPSEKPVDLVLSGVNHGPNLAEDVTHSGTVAAAMEGTLCGIPSIAFSQDFALTEGVGVKWDTARTHAPDIIRGLTAEPWPENTMINVNFPDIAPDAVMGIKCVPHGRRNTDKELTAARDPMGRPYFWLHWGLDTVGGKRPDTDLEWQALGYITVTPLHLDLTDYKHLETLRSKLENIN